MTTWQRDDELSGINGNQSADEVAQVITKTMHDALLEIDRGTFMGGWCGHRRRTMARVLAIGCYSDCRSIAAKASSGEVLLTPFGREVMGHGLS